MRVRPNGPQEQAWKALCALAKEEREWILGQIMDTYCVGCGSVLDTAGECPDECGDDEDDDEDDGADEEGGDDDDE